MTEPVLHPDLPLLQEADLRKKVVLVRFDHNVVKGGVLRDPYRIDRTVGTLFHIVQQGGRPILMTHVGRPRDKHTGLIRCRPEESVEPVVRYLERKLHTTFATPSFVSYEDHGIPGIDTSVNRAIRQLREGAVGGVYLPNTRWFQGEEAVGLTRESFALQLSGLADLYVNDAFGSWQAHASTVDVTHHLPSYAGFLLQEEVAALDRVLEPERPFLAVVAGAKFDTKIGPLSALYDRVDRLVLGGVIYNTWLCAKYGVSIKGVDAADIALARPLVERDRVEGKILELPFVVESALPDARVEGKYRAVPVRDMRPGQVLGHVLDADPASFEDPGVAAAFAGARTIFVNAVMGMTPQFGGGSRALDQAVDDNGEAIKLYGGGDTLQEFKALCPGLYLSVLDDDRYYFFTGGGAVLSALEQGSPYGLAPVRALMEAKRRGQL